MNRIIEIVNFNLKPNISDQQFLEYVKPSDVFVAQQKGFIARRLSKNADGSWLEHIEWETMTDAKAAGDAFVKQPNLAPMMGAIDGESVIMKHNELLITLG